MKKLLSLVLCLFFCYSMCAHEFIAGNFMFANVYTDDPETEVCCMGYVGGSFPQKLVIPSTVEGPKTDNQEETMTYTVTGIWASRKANGYTGAFENTEVVNVVLPSTIKFIESRAFKNCRKLKSINIPEGVTNLSSTFAFCESLESITLPSSLETIGFFNDGSFEGCTSLKEVKIPYGSKLKIIGYSAFNGCSQLKSIDLRGCHMLESIMGGAFGNCEALESVLLPTSDNSSLKEIDGSAFSNDPLLKEIYIANSVTSIGSYAFHDCTSLEYVHLDESYSKLETLGDAAFWNCTSLRKIGFSKGNDSYAMLPDGIEVIETGTFAYCPFVRVKLPVNLKEIKKNAFIKCKNLVSVSIPDQVTKIGKSFYDCDNLESVYFPSSLESIDDGAFSGCPNIKAIYAHMKDPFPIEYWTFNPETYLYAKLYVHETSKYKNVYAWSEFNHIRDMDGSYTYHQFVFDLTATGNGTVSIDREQPYDLGAGYELRPLFDGATVRNEHCRINVEHWVTQNGITVRFNPDPDYKIDKVMFGYDNTDVLTDITSELIKTYSDPIQGIKGGYEYFVLDKKYAPRMEVTFVSNNGDDVESTKDPYVVFNDGTLTFYYDDQRSSRQGSTYDLNEGRNEPGWFANAKNITAVAFDASFVNARPTSTYYWFCGCNNITEIQGLKYLNTCNVTDMGWMFCDCKYLTSLDLSTFNTSKVTLMDGMFFDCSSLTSIDLSNFDTANVTYMWGMFCDCKNLTSLDVSKFNTSNVTDMTNMFYDCIKLSKLTFGSSFTTTGEQVCDYVFDFCGLLKTVTFTGDIPTSLNSKFFEGVGTADSPATLDVLEQYRAHYAAKFNGNMFYGGYFKLSGDNSPDGDAEPYAVLSSDNSVLTFYYDDKKESRDGMDIGPFNTTTYKVNMGWYEQRTKITSVVFDASFANYTSLTSTSYWFYECENLKNISGIDNLTTNEVTNMAFMFFGCSSLSNLDVSGFNTANVTDMKWLFGKCSSLTSLDVGGFNTDQVTDMYGMFYECSGLTSLDVSKFNTNNVNTMGQLFDLCANLTSIGISNFKTEKVTSMWGMFRGCTALKTIYVDEKNWSTANVKYSDLMFSGCINLVGGSGTKYDANHVDVEYARVDKTDVPGYFTLSGDGTADLKDGDSFVYKTCEGVDMKFKVISASGKTIQVGTGEENASAIDKDYEGTVTIPDEINGFTVDEIGYNAFVDCKFSNIVFPSTLTTINGEALLRCTSLKSIFIPRSVKYIAPAAFATCTAVESIVVEEGNEAYDSREGCNAIIISLDNVLHRGCKTTVIPSDIERINFAAFQWTPLEGGLTIPEGVTYIGQAAFYHTTMTSVSLPSTLTYIGGWSFQDCDGLESIGIPNGVTYIGDYAFSFCDNLNVVTIPASVTQIGEKAFNGNDNLNVVVSYITEPNAIADDVFMNNNDFTNATLYVPFGTKAIYEATDGWKNFKNIVELNAKVGDVTGDGNVSKDDIKEVETVILEPSEEFNPNMDVNHDGVVNVADIVITNNIINK